MSRTRKRTTGIPTLAIILGASLAVSGAGCKDEAASNEQGDQTKAEIPFHQQQLDRLREHGLKIGNFEQAAAKPYQAKQCVRGEIEGLDVLLCQYESDKAAASARDKLKLFPAGAVTGAIRLAGPVSLAVADRNKADLKGKRINRIVSTFAGKPSAASPPKSKTSKPAG